MELSVEDQALREEHDVEQGAVTRWRVEQFRAMGFDNAASALLGASRTDLHQARSLVARGCPLPLALQILL